MAFPTRRVPILAYHRVHSADDPQMPEVKSDLHCGHVTLSVFRRQMAALAERGFTTISHERIGRWLYQEEDLPEGRVIAINFDDNRLNVLENAEPVMRKHGFKGSVWAITRLADGNAPVLQLYPWMNWDHLGQLMERGWEIGAHTAAHDFGPALVRGTLGPAGAQRYVDDLMECNAAIERHLGFKPQHLAYPGGEWNDEVEAVAVRFYRTIRHWICDDRPYSYNTFETNPFRLQAINVSMHMPDEVFLQLLDNAV